MEKLFVYGTLHDPKIQIMLLGREIDSVADELSGYFSNTVLFSPYPVAVLDPDASIEGWVLQVTAEELIKLDDYEGENYVRVAVTLNSGTQAWVYCASPILLESAASDDAEI